MSAAADDYARGYYQGHRFPAESLPLLARPDLSRAYIAGVRDALASNPYGHSLVDDAAQGDTGAPGQQQAPPQGGGQRPPTRTPPAYNPNLPPGPAQVVPGNTRFYEVLASSPLGRMPYDVAVSVERKPDQGIVLSLVKLAISFQVVGDRPGDDRRGYRLSGPDGPIAKRVGDLMRQKVLVGNHADPSYFGLDAWYGAKTQDGLRLLGRGELQALGLI